MLADISSNTNHGKNICHNEHFVFVRSIFFLILKTWHFKARFTLWTACEVAQELHRVSVQFTCDSVQCFEWTQIALHRTKDVHAAILRTALRPECMVIFYHAIRCQQTHTTCFWGVVNIALTRVADRKGSVIWMRGEIRASFRTPFTGLKISDKSPGTRMQCPVKKKKHTQASY